MLSFDLSFSSFFSLSFFPLLYLLFKTLSFLSFYIINIFSPPPLPLDIEKSGFLNDGTSPNRFSLPSIS
jgi:hypothetical protein